MIQLYIFHVLPNLGKIEEGLAYLETPIDGEYENQSDHKNPLGLLPKWKRQAFKDHLDTLLEDRRKKEDQVHNQTSPNNTTERGGKQERGEEGTKSNHTTTTSTTSTSTTLSKREPRTLVSIWRSTLDYLKSNRKWIFFAVSASLLVLYLSTREKTKVEKPKTRIQGRLQRKVGNHGASVNNESVKRPSFFHGIGDLFSAFFGTSGKPIV